MFYVLLVLKWIGIILLVVLAVILFLLLLLLFVPIRYRIDAQYTDNSPELSTRVSWACHVVRFDLELVNNKLEKTIRVFGIKIGKKDKQTTEDKPHT